MTISVPLEQSEHILNPLDTNVTDNTTPFTNTFSDDIAIDKRFQQDNGIYQNITLAPIPIVPYNPTDTYEIEDLVFTDDGTGVDRIHKITAVTGEAPQYPESYTTGYETSFDSNVWSDRYMRLTTFPANASLEGIAFTNFSYYPTQYSLAAQFSEDGTKVYFANTNSSATGSDLYSRIYQHSLTTAWDIRTINPVPTGSWLFNGFVRSFSFTKDGAYIWVLIQDEYRISSVTETRLFCYNFTTPWSLVHTKNQMGTYKVLANNTIAVRAHNALDGNQDNYAYTLRTNGTLERWTTTTSWHPETLLWSQTSVVSLAGAEAVSFDWTTAGTKLIISSGHHTGGQSGNCYMQEFTCTANSISNVTSTGVTKTSKFESSDWLGDVLISTDGSKIFEFGGDYGRGLRIMYSSMLTTPNNLSTYFHSILPFYHTETRNGNVYEYKLWKYINDDLYVWETYVNGQYDALWEIPTLNTTILDPSLEEKAIIGSNGSWLGKTFYLRRDSINAIFVRTTTDAPSETRTTTDYTLEVIEKVREINGMEYIQPTKPFLPLDLKNYTKATTFGTMTYTIHAGNRFDTLALGNIKGDNIIVTFYDADGVEINTVDRPINTTRDTHGHLPNWYTTLIYYSDEVIEPVIVGDSTLYGRVEITITTNNPTDEVSLATLLLGISAEAGFTNLTLQNTYKDFSVYEQDPEFGYVNYTERAKVSRYTGTVDIRIENYDMTDRLMTSLGKKLVIVNGSDSPNTEPDSETIFAATQKIGRFTSFTQKTVIADGDMDVMANYSFTLEEIV